MESLVLILHRTLRINTWLNGNFNLPQKCNLNQSVWSFLLGTNEITFMWVLSNPHTLPSSTQRKERQSAHCILYEQVESSWVPAGLHRDCFVLNWYIYLFIFILMWEREVPMLIKIHKWLWLEMLLTLAMTVETYRETWILVSFCF